MDQLDEKQTANFM